MRDMRLLHKIYAHAFGYFWLPCPECGKMFGGHEITGHIGGKQCIMGKVFCPSCAEADEQDNQVAVMTLEEPTRTRSPPR